MNDRGALLVSLLAASLIMVSMFVVLNLTILRSSNILTNTGSDGGGASNPIEEASNIKIQAELKSVLVALNTYYAEQGSYPDDLAELGSYTNTSATGVVYTKCSSSSVVFYYNGANYPGYKIDGFEQTSTSGAVPSC